MTIFSRTKKGSTSTGDIHVASVTELVEMLPPPPTRSAPLPPVDNDKAAVVLTADEVRARIAANRKRQSDVIRRSAALSYTQQSRTASGYIRPGSGWQTHRIKEPTSIEAILREMPLHDAELLPPPLVVRGRDSIQIEKAPSPQQRPEENSEAYSNPRAVPLPPPIKTHIPPPPRSRSRRLTKTKPSSPLSAVFTQPDEEYFSSSSRDSARNSASTTNSVASSATSTSSILNVQVETKRADTKRASIKPPNFSKPSLASRRAKPVEELDISLPYSSGKEEQVVKTAKSAIPTWRYEDLREDNELPVAVTTIPPTHARNQSWGYPRKSPFMGSRFRRKNLSMTAL